MKCICCSRNPEANNTTFKHSSTPKPQYHLSQQKKFSANNYNSRKKLHKSLSPTEIKSNKQIIPKLLNLNSNLENHKPQNHNIEKKHRSNKNEIRFNKKVFDLGFES